MSGLMDGYEAHDRWHPWKPRIEHLPGGYAVREEKPPEGWEPPGPVGFVTNARIHSISLDLEPGPHGGRIELVESSAAEPLRWEGDDG